MDAVIAEIRERIDEIATMAGVPRRPWESELPSQAKPAATRRRGAKKGEDKEQNES